ncbi:ATP-binding protein [Flavobacterium sp.]|uniref:sensor histidine kinase n=1 Tax=Flavobacterium sp. TaxID=239 RepID=UPI0025C03E6F|nr:ATP-binding protein [Flavobacterium sp.]
MKHFYTSFVLFFAFATAFAQPAIGMAQNPLYKNYTKKQADSLEIRLKTEPDKGVRMAINKELSFYYQAVSNDRSLYYAEQELKLTKQLKQFLWQVQANWYIGYSSAYQGDYAKAAKAFIEAFDILESKDCEKNIWGLRYFTSDGNPHHAKLNVLANTIHDRAHVYGYTGTGKKQLAGYREAAKIARTIGDTTTMSVAYMNIGNALLNGDSAIYYSRKGLAFADAIGFENYKENILLSIGRFHYRKKAYDSTEIYARKAIEVSERNQRLAMRSDGYFSLGMVAYKKNHLDASIFYMKKALEGIETVDMPDRGLSIYRRLAKLYMLAKQNDSALAYYKIIVPLGDSLNRIANENLRKYQTVDFDQAMRLQQLEKKKVEEESKFNTYIFAAGLAVFIGIGLFLFRNNRQKQKANKALENTLANLKSTQSQLIQSEKMASLGELTAGIAHEIQNPLNFINNFSDVSRELIVEILDERRKTNDERDDEFVNEILSDIDQNLEKISHHGKRADAIVKGMLQHSRTTSGEKEATDLNALTDEYLRLAYHGLRAKDKSFNAELITNFDENIPKVNVIPQDVGRVLLNLITNAFYATQERSKFEGESFKPMVEVSTSSVGNNIEISVKDNGNGIPSEIVDKIFQPFFTTKPTGEGTGLGLSLAYDIVKAHGGTIHATSVPSNGTTFTITLSMA